MNKDTIRQIAVILATLVTLVVNTLANVLPLNGINTGAISDQFAVYFVPAGYVFSIWGLIYLLLIAFTIYQALPAQKSNPVMQKTGWLYVVSAAANSSWIFFWHYQIFPLTLVMMLILLATLILIYLKLETGRKPADPSTRLLIRLPFSVYLGWITVATIANITDVLSLTGWNGFGISGQVWAVIMLAAAILIALLMTLLRRDAAFLAVLVWAFAGIGVKFGTSSLVGMAAFISTAVVAGFLVYSLIKGPNYAQ